nr:M24 family metallopeptidase C-terminal domain-containing protein [uncultured Muribaculum sp.]
METSMFNDDEIKWINEYHKKVYDLLTPSLNEKETAWLAAKTQPISRK